VDHTPAKRILFGTLAVLLPLAVLALAELALRAGGVASERQELFLPVPQDTRYVVVNPRFAGRYFAGFEPDVAPQPFLRDKPAGAHRYFVLGGSSAAGFPYQFHHGFPARLEEMLRLNRPGERVEVINLAMTAVNSYTLWDIHRELLRFDPDGILIYAGHNEYYGALGAAVVPGWMRPLSVRRLVLRLQRLHLVAVAAGLFRRSGNGDGDGTGAAVPPADRTLMARMARDRLVHRGEDRYEEGIGHFERNMGDVVGTFRLHGIPVYLATVVSNKAGQAPLSGDARAVEYFERAEAAPRQADEQGGPRLVPKAAQELYRRAMEEDPLRFRAPGRINRSIRWLSEIDGVTLVDAHAITTPEGGLLPFAPEYFTDHLHPDYRGYGLLAGAFFHAMETHAAAETGGSITGHSGNGEAGDGKAGYDKAAAGKAFELLLMAPPDPLEELVVAHTLEVLKSDFPFERDPDRQRPAAVHRERLNRYRASGDPLPMAAHDYITGERPLAAGLAQLASAYRDRGQHNEALRLLRSLHHLQPLNPDLDALILDYLSALARGGGADRHDLSVRPASAIPLWVRLTAAGVDHDTWLLAVEALMEHGLFRESLLWLDVWEGHDPPADYYRLRARWHIEQGDHQGAQHWFREYYRRIR
jgi:tetratricopeptide (TPR) repeat protein